MQKLRSRERTSRSSRPNVKRFATRCVLLYVTASIMIMLALATNVSCLTKTSVIYVESNDRVVWLDANSISPYDGVLVGETRYEELLDYEDKVLSGDCE